MASNGHTLVGYGASSMQGVGDSNGGFFARITRLLLKSHADWQFFNLGVGGNTTRDMLRRIEQVKPYHPFDSVVILGCNDLPRERDGKPENRTSLEEYGRNLDAMLPNLRSGYSLFISSFRPDPIRTGVQTATMDQYMDVAIRQAKQHGFEIWDLYHELRDSTDLPRYWAADGMHFNDVGHQFLADGVLSRLATLSAYQR